jgi:hypothetical protein
MTTLPPLLVGLPKGVVPWRISALAMCLSGLPASFTWIVKERGAMRISSWVVGTL